MFFNAWSDIGRVLVVGGLAYAGLVLLLRLTGKRTLSKMNAFDLVVTVALGSTLATILLSKDVALPPQPALAGRSFFLYIASMRWVTRKPPKMFTAAKAAASAPAPREIQTLPACSSAPATPAAAAIKAPTMITEEIAFVTAIRGVCRAGVTDHTT